MVNKTATEKTETVYAIVKDNEYVNLKQGQVFEIEKVLKKHVVLKNDKRRYLKTSFNFELQDGTIFRKDTKQLSKWRRENGTQRKIEA